jgi:hypothetical protein
MDNEQKKQIFKRRQRSLNKTEVVSPVKLSIKRKKSRKITWKQVEAALNADDNEMANFGTKKDSERSLSSGIDNGNPYNPNEMDTSEEKSPLNQLKKDKSPKLIKLRENPNEMSDSDNDEEEDEEDQTDDIVGDKTMEAIVEKNNSPRLNKIINKIDSNYSVSKSRRSIMKQKKVLKFKVREEESEEIKERLVRLQMLEKGSIEAQESLMNDSGMKMNH